MRKLVLIGSLLFIFCACEQKVSIYFEKPQPENVKDHTRFPKRLWGSYLNLTDSSHLIITPNRVIISGEQKLFRLHKAQLPEAKMQLEGKVLIDRETGDRLSVELAGDSIFYKLPYRDTLFQLSETALLRKFKGHYFLNSKMEDKTWEVKSLTYKRGAIILSEIGKQADIEKLKAMTLTQADSTNRFNPTRKQFRQFVKENGFSANQVFIKTSN